MRAFNAAGFLKSERVGAPTHFPILLRARLQLLFWISLWLVAIPVGLLGFFSMLLWVYGVDD